MLVVDLSVGVTLRTHSSHKVECGQASAGTNSGIPYFVGLAASPTDTIGGIIGLGWRTNSTIVSDQVVSRFTLAGTIDPLFIGVTGRNTEPQTEQVSLVTHTLLGDGRVGGVESASSAGSIGHLVVLRQTDTGLRSNIIDAFGIAGDSADAQTLIIDLIPGTLSANAIDGVVSSDTAALTIGKDLIDSTSNHTEASLVVVSRGASTGSGLNIKSGVSRALGTGSIDKIVTLGTTA